ncbi:polysaccharide pyruvyl transferase family protein [Arcobacter sp. CECT 8989]|uniref:polysaccharide pyruvyl transferase family protein n=1 Tax=Arcobacter sp. CECT 8989 TaxID=2044509 RepID=UPI0013E93F5B|nr:polysaccharide pyruvyl transferase family protein [Arcobacter sp. CECT 8989]
MLIEIRGVGFVNKGAELMLHAILEKIKSRFPKARFVMAPSLNVSPYEKRAELSLYQKVTYEKLGLDLGDFFVSLVPKKRRKMYGLVRQKEVDIVLDAAGFAHGDQWGVKNTKKLFKFSQKLKRNNAKLILLPQAFGPFEKREIKETMKELLRNCDLVFAREEVSFNYLTSFTSQKNIFNMPDFTNLVKAKEVEDFDFEKNDFCIIPNYKMVSKSWINSSDNNYIKLISESIKYLREKGKNPFILVHEGKKDFVLAEEIANKVGGINIFKEEDPLKVKGIIKQSHGVIGSRFHSLVSSLSQATPALGTSWSHKYQMLFKDYDFEEGILTLDSSVDDIRRKVDILIDENSKEKLVLKLENKSKYLKELSNQMWEKVFKEIETKA